MTKEKPIKVIQGAGMSGWARTVRLNRKKYGGTV